MKSGRRQWMSKDGRDALVARIERDLLEDRPARGEQSTGAAVNPPTAAPTLPPFVAERVPERYTNGTDPDTSWRAVAVAQAEFPLASALDHLHASVAPALEALEAAGKVDAAGLLRSELALTPTEQELLRLWRRVTHGDD